MAKDPAFLFYPNDWLGGTLTFSRAQKGAYMDLLMCQFNQGHMSIQDIKDVLGSDFPMWDSKLKKKFSEDENGDFYNERLDFEVTKRKKFTEHQKENGSKGGRPIQPKNNPSETHGLTQIETQPITQTVTQHKTQEKPKQKPLENENENTNCSIGNLSACKNRETENVRGKPIPELAIAHIRGLGEIQIKTLPTENAWELTELREMITNSEHQFQSIASTKKPMNNVLNFQAILQSFVDMIQSSGQYQTSAELRKYFTNWIGKKNGTLEKFVEELKEDKPKTKNKNSFV